MSGAGAMQAGLGPAGQDLVVLVQSGPVDGVPLALEYNRGIFPLDENGAYGSIHPVDQKVRLALLNKLGAIPAAPDQGFDWTTPFEWGIKLTADVTDRARDAVARAGVVIDVDIQELSISVSSDRTSGRISFVYDYVNLRTGKKVTVP